MCLRKLCPVRLFQSLVRHRPQLVRIQRHHPLQTKRLFHSLRSSEILPLLHLADAPESAGKDRGSVICGLAYSHQRRRRKYLFHQGDYEKYLGMWECGVWVGWGR